MNKQLTIIIIFLALIISTPKLFPQGSLSGKVIDSISTERLIGANIYITGTSLGSSSNIEGNYKITGIPAGKYTLKVSYVGYKAREYTIEIESGKAKYLNLVILPDVIEGQEIVVTGQFAGQVAAINQQLTSNTIINVISEQKIQELPDNNAAESIGRLPGIALVRSGGEASKVSLRGLDAKFSSVSIDGIRVASTDADDRGVDLSTISQGSLAGIELYKALTSDKDADAIAGSVNLVTKKAPVNRLLYLDSKGGYNKLDNSYNQYNFNLRYGERFFDDVLGVQVLGNLEKKIRSNESNALYYDQSSLITPTSKDWLYSNFQLNYVNETRKRDGISLLLDISTPDSGTIKFNTIYNKTSRDVMTYGRNYPSFSTISITYAARNAQQDINSFTTYLGGDNNFAGLSLNWGLSFAQSKSETPFDYQLDFQETSKTDTSGALISGMRPLPASLHHGPLEQIISYAFNNYNQATLYDGYNRHAKNYSKESTLFLNLSKSYNADELFSGEVKIGGRYKSNYKFRDSTEYIAPYYNIPVPGFTRLPDGTIVAKSYNGTRFFNIPTSGGRSPVTFFLNPGSVTRNVYNLYNLNPLIDKWALIQWHDLNVNGFSNSDGSGPEYSENISLSAGNYNLKERISAAYIMNTLNFGNQLTVVAGLRVESENNIYNSKYSPSTLSGFPSPTGDVRDTTSGHKETIWLPNLQCLYKPTDFLSIRLAAYRSISRPDFNKRLATHISQAAGTFYPTNNLTIGNPDLKDAKAYNYEINTSLYSNYIGLFSVSAYYKEIKDMYHTISGLELFYQDGPRILDSLGINIGNPFGSGDFNITYQSNSPKPTRIWGFEVEHQINFWFLPSILSNFILSYNFSIIRSETYIPTTAYQNYFLQIGPVKVPKVKPVVVDNKQKLENSPDFLLNVSLGYDIAGFSARISLFHQSKSNSYFSYDGKSDQQINAFTRLDLALKQKINEYITVTFNLNNITNVEEGTSLINRVYGWTVLNTSQRYGMTGDLGVRVSL
jgi:TonB-dependent receptor